MSVSADLGHLTLTLATGGDIQGDCQGMAECGREGAGVGGRERVWASLCMAELRTFLTSNYCTVPNWTNTTYWNDSHMEVIPSTHCEEISEQG